MFSFVQNITSVLKPLKTEVLGESFARKQRYLKRQDGDSLNNLDDQTVSDIEDGSVFSVKSLILFLEDFLEKRLESKLFSDSQIQKVPISCWFKNQRSNDEEFVQSRNAAKAYAHAAKTLGVPFKGAQETKVPVSMQKESKGIYLLIRDLRDLQEAGIQYLDINRQETFIEGVFSAVDKAKADKI